MNFLMRPSHTAHVDEPPVHEISKGTQRVTSPAATLEGLIAEDLFPNNFVDEVKDEVGGENGSVAGLSSKIDPPVLENLSDVTEEEGWITIPHKYSQPTVGDWTVLEAEATKLWLELMIVVTVVEAVVVECSPAVGKCVRNSGGGMRRMQVLLQVNVAVDSQRDPVLEILQFEKYNNVLALVAHLKSPLFLDHLALNSSLLATSEVTPCHHFLLKVLPHLLQLQALNRTLNLKIGIGSHLRSL